MYYVSILCLYTLALCLEAYLSERHQSAHEINAALGRPRVVLQQ